MNRGARPPRLLDPDAGEASCRCLGIDNCIADGAVAQVVLDQSRIGAFLGEREAAAQHVRMDGEAEPGAFTGALDDDLHDVGRQGAATLADHRWRVRAEGRRRVAPF